MLEIGLDSVCIWKEQGGTINYRWCGHKHRLRAQNMQPAFLLRIFIDKQIDYSQVYCLSVVYLSMLSVYELHGERQ